MKKLLLLSLFAFCMLSSVFYYRSGFTQTGTTKKLRLQKPDIVDQVSIGYNNWRYEMQNNGVYMLDAKNGSSGGEFPRGSGHYIVYSGGFSLGVIKNGRKVVTKAFPSDGGTQLRPGALLNSGVPFSNLVASDPLSADNRVYYISDDHEEPNWPGLREENGEPVHIAAAQTWAVFNDRDTTAELTHYEHAVGSGIGAEVVLESFALDAGALADAVILKFMIQNKTNVTYNGAYFSVYMDPDVEYSSNDLLGCDTLLGVGYCYNADNTDLGKCVGVDILQGPVVDASYVGPYFAQKFISNTSVIQYDSTARRYLPTSLPAGKIWLGMTSSNGLYGGAAPDDDSSTYNIIAGSHSDGTPKYGGGIRYRYEFPGDPVTQPSGTTIDDPVMHLNFMADQRLHTCVGPFKLEAGKAQEIWVGVIGAESTNRLTAITKMRETDAIVQNAFSAGLPVPASPPSPKISVIALDGKVVVTWDNSAEHFVDTYGRIAGVTAANGYSQEYDSTDFQGYRVYRSRTGLQGSFTMLAQYDIVDGITYVTTGKLSENGNVTLEEKVIGSDNGLRYEYIDTTVSNNYAYYYSATAYDAQAYITSPHVLILGSDSVHTPAGVPGTLESPQLANVALALPMKPIIGAVYDASVDTVAHTGISDGRVRIELVDPTKVQTGIYSIHFIILPLDSQSHPLVGAEYLPSTLVVYQVLLGDSVRPISSRSDDPRTFYDVNGNGTFEVLTDIKLDESYFGEDQSTSTVDYPIIVDGIRIVVYGPSLDFKAFNCTANASGPLNPVAACAATYVLYGFGFPSDDPDMSQTQQVNGSYWFMCNASGVTTADGTYDNYIENSVTTWNNVNAAGKRGFDILVPNDFEIRFTAAGQIAQINGQSTQRTLPFEVWNVTTGTKLLLTTLDDNANGVFDLIAEDSPISNGDNDPVTDRYYIWNPTDMSAGTAGYDAWVIANTGITSANGFDRVLGRQKLTSWNGGSVSDVTFPANQIAPMPEVGTIFRINTTKPNTPADVFTFTATGNTVITSRKELKNSLKNIKVVPNPFYIFSSFDTQFDKTVKFTNLPSSCKIRIYTVAGDIVRTLRHNMSSDNDRVNTDPYNEDYIPADDATSIERWDLKNENGRYVAGGMYIALIDTPYGKTFVKFAVIR